MPQNSMRYLHHDKQDYSVTNKRLFCHPER